MEKCKAPELQIARDTEGLSKEQNKRALIYGLGCLAFKMFTGVFPFETTKSILNAGRPKNSTNLKDYTALDSALESSRTYGLEFLRQKFNLVFRPNENGVFIDRKVFFIIAWMLQLYPVDRPSLVRVSDFWRFDDVKQEDKKELDGYMLRELQYRFEEMRAAKLR